MTVSISWLRLLINDLQFRRYIQKRALNRVLVLIMTTKLSKLMKWFKTYKTEYPKNRTCLFYETKNLFNCTLD